MSVEPMHFLAEAFAVAKAEGYLDIQTSGEKEALTLRLQFYNLIRKCRRLAKPGGPPAAPVVEQIVEDAGLVMIALPKDLPGTLRFCRPEHSPTAKVMMGALEASEAGREILDRLETRKIEAAAQFAAEAAAIRESELRQLAGMAEGAGESSAEAVAKARMAKYLGEGK